MIAKSHHWQIHALAVTVAGLVGLSGPSAQALSLGRITVQSALGEPLRAEIDVPEINAEEFASLKAFVASPEAFRAAKLEYNPAMAGLQVTPQRRADGRTTIRLSGNRAINEPFVDLIFEASWASGRIVREYTMLFDPPASRAAVVAAPAPAQIPVQSPVDNRVAPASATPKPPATTAAEPRANGDKRGATDSRAAAPMRGEGKQMTVRAGTTASKIAAATKSAAVSLDQMLVSMLRSNPHAFLDDNVNRIKAGSVIRIPTAEQAAATPAAQATQIIVAQSKNFNEFRRRLASGAPAARVDAAAQKASGSIQTEVKDKAPLSGASDKLTLSKGSVPGLPSQDQLARERSAKESASRAGEIAKNINDLSAIGATSVASAPAASPSQPASTPAPAPKPSAVAAPKLATVAPPAPNATFFDGLLENSLLPAGAAGLIALLVGWLFYRARQRKKPSDGSSAFADSRLRPDSFFGPTSVQNSKEGATSGSSMMYSASQLNAVDDVDPVAEADVYLAYGRDLQAEEILKEALRSNPERVAIHQKLLEIFARRRDTKGFEEMAALAFQITQGEGLDWERIRKLGFGLDPGNPRYRPGGPSNATGDTVPPSIFGDEASQQADDQAPALPRTSPTPPAASVDLDLDLDFSLDEQPAAVGGDAATSRTEPTTPASDDSAKTGSTPVAAAEPAAPAQDSNMLQFDLGSLSLDLDNAPDAPAPAASDKKPKPPAV